MARTGRPPVQIDKRKFENLCAIHCTKDEIAGIFDCSPDTIENFCKKTYFDEKGEPMTFSATFKRYSAGGKASLRRTQFRLAEKSAAMAIFLGKQYLGQTDKIEQTVTEVEDLSPLAAMLAGDDAAREATTDESDTQ